MDITVVRKNIWSAIKMNNTTIKELSKNIGVTQGTLYRNMERTKSISLHIICAIAEFFDLSLDELCYGEITEQEKENEEDMNENAKIVSVFTDGACSGNPGKGGWGAIVRYKNKEKVISGGDSQTTNNKMELTAVIEALKTLKMPCCVTVYTDSQYVAKGYNEWLAGWIKNNWQRKTGPVANADLWKELLQVAEMHTIKFVWVRGHAGHPENERCDKLARSEIEKG